MRRVMSRSLQRLTGVRCRISSIAAALAVLGAVATPSVAQTVPATDTANAVRIAVASPKVDLGAGSSGDAMTTSVAATIVSTLHGPSIELVPLSARLDVLIQAEASEKHAQFVLFTTVSRKTKKPSILKRAAKVAGPAAGFFPGVGAVAGQVGRGAAEVVSTVSGTTQEQDEFTLEYRLTGPDTTATRATKTLTRKAVHAGEDVLRPLMEEMGNELLVAISAGR